MTDFYEISHLIRSQFPQFYLEEGPELVTFVEEYYKWFEQEGGLNKSRKLLTNRDIDETMEVFLQFFRKKYMVGIPDSTIADKRELQKHILDLYRSKGSEAGLRLLFRLLYNEDIEIYIPSYDILKTSDGIWIEEDYLEISSTRLFQEFNNKRITGFDSGAFAFVDRIERRVVNNKNIFLLFLTDINGEFIPNERVFFEGANLSECPFVLGSPKELDVTSVSPGYEIGDEVTAITGSGQGLKAIVSETEIGRGIIEFEIVNGGNGYSVGVELDVTTGANTTGFGASGFVSEIEDTFIYQQDLGGVIEPYLDVPLDSNTFAFDGTDTSSFGQANLDIIISDALILQDVELGRIKTLTVNSQGQDYDGFVNVSVFDPIIGPLNASDDEGGLLGQNAIILGNAIIGTLVKELRATTSGFGYSNESVTFVAPDKTDIKADIILGGTGFLNGFWKNTQGFLNADKFIQDSFFYQEYSYEIGSSKSLDKYIQVLKATTHPAGNEVFSRGVITSRNDFTPKLLSFSIEQS